MAARKPRKKSPTKKAGASEGRSPSRRDATPERLSLNSADPNGGRLDALRELFPEAFREGRVDFDQLRRVLGEAVDDGSERYGLTWAGKADAIHAVQSPSVATLRPDPDRSVNFDETQNVFIEGDNLEVLKLLQKAYHGRVKLIYIDPPYNTGKEFIYPDNYREGLKEYLRYSGQTDEAGARYSTNTEASGRYHSRWLSMMYPRLFLARNLLRQDGAIFVSIDDHEVQNLRALMDEIFGPENFIASVVWQKVFSPKNSAEYFSEDHDYVLLYGRDKQIWRPNLLERSEKATARYTNPDNDPRGAWTSSDLTARNYYSLGSYEVVGPTGKRFRPGSGRYWTIKKKDFDDLDSDNRIWWGKSGKNMPRLKRFSDEVKEGVVPQTLWKYEEVGHTQKAKRELVKYAPVKHTENVLNSVKPTRLIQRMLQIGTDANEADIVLDFFAGSAPTGHAVWRQNGEDGGNRRFVMVQLPEPMKKPEPELDSLFDLGRSRLVNVGEELSKEASGDQDLGFRVFRLAESNFQIWDGDVESDTDALTRQLQLYADHVKPDRGDDDLLYEILLKAGLPLTEPGEVQKVGGARIHWFEAEGLAVCLERSLKRKHMHGIMELAPRRVICLDQAFGGNDELKTNTVLEMRSHDIEFRTV